jgi:hypothetical protein
MDTTQQGMDNLQRLFKSTDQVFKGVPEGMVFWLVPAGAEAENEPAAADVIHSGGHLGRQRRVAKAGAKHHRAKLHARCDRRNGAQNRPAIPDAV